MLKMQNLQNDSLGNMAHSPYPVKLASVHIGCEDRNVPPGGGVPVGIVVSLLGAFKTTAIVAIWVLASGCGAAVVPHVLIGIEQALVTFPHLAILIVPGNHDEQDMNDPFRRQPIPHKGSVIVQPASHIPDGKTSTDDKGRIGSHP